MFAVDLRPGRRHRSWGLLRWLLGLAVLVGTGVLLRLLTRPLGAVDRMLVADLVAVRTSPLTALAHGFSVLGRTPTVLALAIVVDLAWAAAARMPGRYPTVLVSAVSAIIVQNAVKAIIERPRPMVLHLEHVTSSSFPSGHATDVTALLAAVIMRLWPVCRRRDLRALILLSGAALVVGVCLSRLYLGVHYPTDVACGSLLGGGCAVLARRLSLPPAAAASERRPVPETD